MMSKFDWRSCFSTGQVRRSQRSRQVEGQSRSHAPVVLAVEAVFPVTSLRIAQRRSHLIVTGEADQKVGDFVPGNAGRSVRCRKG